MRLINNNYPQYTHTSNRAKSYCNNFTADIDFTHGFTIHGLVYFFALWDMLQCNIYKQFWYGIKLPQGLLRLIKSDTYKVRGRGDFSIKLNKTMGKKLVKYNHQHQKQINKFMQLFKAAWMFRNFFNSLDFKKTSSRALDLSIWKMFKIGVFLCVILCLIMPDPTQAFVGKCYYETFFFIYRRFSYY